MRQTILRVHQVLAWVVLAGLLFQFYWAGAALFGVTSFDLHRIRGYLLAIPILLLLALALAGRLGRRLIGLSALLVVLTIVQVMLPSLRSSVPLVAALPPSTPWRCWGSAPPSPATRGRKPWCGAAPGRLRGADKGASGRSRPAGTLRDAGGYPHWTGLAAVPTGNGGVTPPPR